MRKSVCFHFVLLFFFLMFLNSCSFNRLAVRMIAHTLSGKDAGTVFTGDDDPELIGAALPFALKMYESLLQADPKNIDLLRMTGSGYISYANAFLQSPAEQMGYRQKIKRERMLKEAAGLYRRGSGYISRALDLRHPGFSEKMGKGDWGGAFKNVSAEDVPFLYWKAAAILGEFSVDSFNPSLMIHVSKGVAYAAEALYLNPGYNRGALHEILLSVFASIPDALLYRAGDRKKDFSVYKIFETCYKEKGKNFDSMTAEEKAQFHFERAVFWSRGLKVSPYVAYATSVCVKNQNYSQFRKMLQDALKIEVNKDIPDRLVNVIAQRKARWYLAHSDDYFILP